MKLLSNLPRTKALVANMVANKDVRGLQRMQDEFSTMLERIQKTTPNVRDRNIDTILTISELLTTVREALKELNAFDDDSVITVEWLAPDTEL